MQSVAVKTGTKVVIYASMVSSNSRLSVLTYRLVIVATVHVPCIVLWICVWCFDLDGP